MENNGHANIIRSEETSGWYSEEYITSSLIVFLKKNGYKIHEEKPKNLAANKSEKILTVSKFFTKEIIGIKGLQHVPDRTSLLKVLDKNEASPLAKKRFYESLFNSFINFGRYYSNENVVGAMALPTVEKYKAIIDTVHEYFTSNNLYFKLYMVDEDGEVEVLNLNEKDHK